MGMGGPGRRPRRQRAHPRHRQVLRRAVRRVREGVRGVTHAGGLDSRSLLLPLQLSRASLERAVDQVLVQERVAGRRPVRLERLDAQLLGQLGDLSVLQLRDHVRNRRRTLLPRDHLHRQRVLRPAARPRHRHHHLRKLHRFGHIAAPAPVDDPAVRLQDGGADHGRRPAQHRGGGAALPPGGAPHAARGGRRAGQAAQPAAGRRRQGVGGGGPAAGAGLLSSLAPQQHRLDGGLRHAGPAPRLQDQPVAPTRQQATPVGAGGRGGGGGGSGGRRQGGARRARRPRSGQRGARRRRASRGRRAGGRLPGPAVHPQGPALPGDPRVERRLVHHQHQLHDPAAGVRAVAGPLGGLVGAAALGGLAARPRRALRRRRPLRHELHAQALLLRGGPRPERPSAQPAARGGRRLRPAGRPVRPLRPRLGPVHRHHGRRARRHARPRAPHRLLRHLPVRQRRLPAGRAAALQPRLRAPRLLPGHLHGPRPRLRGRHLPLVHAAAHPQAQAPPARQSRLIRLALVSLLVHMFQLILDPLTHNCVNIITPRYIM